MFEVLEDRCLLATITVTNTGDSGTGSLRDAINAVNGGSADTIDFNLSGSFVIKPLTALPPITHKVLIDGASQPSYAGTPLVMIDGSGLAGGGDGLAFATSAVSTSTVKGLAIGHFSGVGVRILSTADTITLTQDYIGLDLTGAAAPNGVGVSIEGSGSNIIGGISGTAGNVISGNTGAGISITGSTARLNTIEDNIIGLNPAANAKIPNATGILLAGTGAATSGATNNTIGGLVAAARNVISGNTGAGIELSDAGTTANTVEGNYIGTDGSGATALGNAIGVQIVSSAATNTVGGSSTAARNVISGNTQFDVLIDGSSANIVDGNYIGVEQNGVTALTGAPLNAVGVGIQNNATGNTIGGSTIASANVISGHGGATGAGVWIRGLTGSTGTAATTNAVQSNFIGVGTDGATVLPNEVGVLLTDGTTNNVIGGLNTGNGNTISGNLSDGVRLTGSTTTGNALQGNRIGVASNGTTSVPNGGNGVMISGPSGTQIGGTQTGAGNTIGNNTLQGVDVTAGTGNSILRNSIYSNTAGGVLLDSSGGTKPNNLQVAPTLTKASSGGGTTAVSGTIQAAASTTYTVDLYTDPTAAAGGSGQGKTYLATATVTTDSTGLGTFNASSPTVVPVGQVVSALATSPTGDTSQFAQNIATINVKTNVSITMTGTALPPTTTGQVGNGSFLSYPITVSNGGPDDATGVVVTDTLPSGVTFVGATSPQGTISQTGSTVTINLGTVAKNTTQTFTLTVVAPSTVANPPSTITNKAAVAVGPGIDNTSQTTTASVDTKVVAGVDLQVEKVALPTPPQIGTDFTYIVTVTNASSTLADGVVLTDMLPAGLTFVSAKSTQGTPTESGGVVTVPIGTLPPSGITATSAGSSATVYITVHPTTNGPFTNTATATANEPQQVAGDNVEVNTVTPVAAPVNPIATPVQVAAVARVGVHHQKGHVVITFSQPLDSSSAQLLANYALLAALPNGAFGPHSPYIRLKSASYNATHHTVTLTPVNSYSFFKKVRLTVVGQPFQGVRGSNGLFLAGATSGQTGTNYVVTFQGFGPKARRA